MTEEEIKQILLNDVLGLWPSHYDRVKAERAAKRIADGVRRGLNKPAPPPHYPTRACDCGAERAGTPKHATWCQLVK